MSFRPIDVQTSIPRVSELTPMQQHQQQRPAMEQTALGNAAQKTAERDMKRSTETEGAAHKSISDRDAKERNGRQSKGQTQPDEEEAKQPKKTEHPFKGHHIDFSL